VLETLNDATHLRADLGFDSIDFAELTVKIEYKLGVDVFAHGIVSSVGEILQIIQTNKPSK
jgi:acyl carrier protein